MGTARIRVHVFDATSEESLPGLYDCVQLLRLSELQQCLRGEPVRTLIRPKSLRRTPRFVEYEVDVESPFIGEVRLYDPPRELWPAQEWVLIYPGKSSEVPVAVYPDVSSWPGNGREKLREVLLDHASRLGSYGAIKGRFIAPESPPFYYFSDTQGWLRRVEGMGRADSVPLYPQILPEAMAEPWCEIPISPGEWELIVTGARIKPWTHRLLLAPGQIVELGDVRLALSD